jgi:AcrR family transcriptional regulator
VTKAEKTRQFIIEATAPLFNQKGFDGTTLSDLTSVTGLTKGAIYGNFSDKEEIATEAFRYSIQKVKAMAHASLEGKITYKAQLLALLDFYSKYVFTPPVEGGCPLLNTAIEADDHRTSMRRMVSKELMKTIDFMASLVKKGIEAKEFVQSAEPRKIAYTIFCSIEGALMFSRVERSREPMDIIIEHCKKILDQITK